MRPFPLGEQLPVPSSSKTTYWPSHVNSAECQNQTELLSMGCSVSGCTGSLMSQIWPSLMQDAAALWIARKTVMSWQATAPFHGGAEICGCAITSALSGASSGTETIEILLNGCWHGPPMFCEAINKISIV